jgi:hypothetical protein
MSWLGVLLIGLACTDLVHSAGQRGVRPQAVGAGVVVAVGLLAGLSAPLDLLALAVAAGMVWAWGWSVTRGFGRDQAWLPLLVLGCSVGLAVLVGAAAGPGGGALGAWLDASDLGAWAQTPPDRFLLLLGALGIQLSTGNVVVRLVLATTGTLHPAKDGSLPPTPLKGGRLLGPMERLLILALALAGEITAAGIVIAAKGLLRYPELSSPREQTQVHRLTEYVLVGSFASWLWALMPLVVLTG